MVEITTNSVWCENCDGYYPKGECDCYSEQQKIFIRRHGFDNVISKDGDIVVWGGRTGSKCLIWCNEEDGNDDSHSLYYDEETIMSEYLHGFIGCGYERALAEYEADLKEYEERMREEDE